MREVGMYIMVLLYVAAGVIHFVNPGTFLKIMPKYLPYPLFLVYLSGLCEIVFASLLLFPVTRSTGAWLLIVLLLAVFPANIQMSVDFYRAQNPYFWLTILRLPLQFVLIWWAWSYTR